MLHERTGDGQTLALAARKVRAALRHRGIEPLRLIEHKGALGNPERMKHVGLSRVFVAKAQIACYGAREQPCLLRHIGNAPANLVLRKVVQINAVQANGALGGIVEAQQELGHRRFARARRANDRGRLTAATGKAQIAQRVLVGVVKTKRHMIEHGDRVGSVCGLRRPVAQHSLAVHDARLDFEHLLRTVEARRGARKRQNHHLRHHHKEKNQDRVFQHGRNAADLHGVDAHAVAAHPQHRHLGDVHQKEAGAVEAHKQVVDLDGVGRVIAKHLVQALLLVALLVKCADDAHAHDVLAQHHVHAVDKALQAHKDRRGVSHRKDRRHQHDRNHHAQQRAHGGIDEPSKNDACHG